MVLNEQQCQWCHDGIKACNDAIALLERCAKTGDETIELPLQQSKHRLGVLQGYLQEFGPKPDEVVLK